MSTHTNSIPYVSSAACIIGFAMQRYVEDIRVLSLLEAVDEEIFKSLVKDLEAELKRLDLLVTENGVKRVTSFPNPASADVDITHPYGLEYAKIVKNMDKLVLLLCDLEMARTITDIDFKKTREKWYQLIRDGGFRITKLAKETLAQAQQEQKEKEAAAAKEEEGTRSSVSAPLGPTEVAESPVNETPEPETAVPGGNGKRSPRKTAKPGTEEQHLEVPPGAVLTGAEEAVPPLEQAV
jgi:hypothetical protein